MTRLSSAWLRLTPRARGGLGIGIVLAVVAAVTGVILAGGGGEAPAAAPERTTTTTTTTAPTTTAPTTTTAPAGPVAPLTGQPTGDPGHLQRPALAVKVDNLDTAHESALPQQGVSQADVVFEEIVEGDITRLVAVFHSQDPGLVGPVRSARTTDVHLLPQLGRVLLAWSGGNGAVVGAVRGTPEIVDVGHDAASNAYHRDRARKAPHTLFITPVDLWARTPTGSGPPPALFRYRTTGQANPASAAPAAGVDLTWGSGRASAPVSWRWDANRTQYMRSQAGRNHVEVGGTQLSAANVVVLTTEYRPSPADTRSPEAQSIGTGEAFVYTNG